MSAPSFDAYTQAEATKPGIGMSRRVGWVTSVPMTASTSLRAASAHTSLVLPAAVPVAAGEPVGLAAVPPAAVPLGEDVAGEVDTGDEVAPATVPLAVAVADAVAVVVGVAGVGEAPPVDDGEHAVRNRTAKSVADAINEFLMRYT